MASSEDLPIEAVNLGWHYYYWNGWTLVNKNDHILKEYDHRPSLAELFEDCRELIAQGSN